MPTFRRLINHGFDRQDRTSGLLGMKISKEARIGLIVTVGIAALFWGINYLKGKDFFTSQKLVYAVYDHVDGLAPSNTVQVNGMKVGMVKSLSLFPDRSGRILVSMHLKNEVVVPRNSTAEIFGTDLLGTKGIRLVLGDATEELQDGDTLVSAIQQSLSESVSAQVAPIKQKAENLLSSMDSVLIIVRTVFNEKTKDNLKRSFESISNSLLSIEHVTGSLDTGLTANGKLASMLASLESILANFRKNNDAITNAINNFSSISDTLGRANLAMTIENTRKTLEETSSLLRKVNTGEGSLGQLATNDSLYHNLNSTSRSLDLLLTDFRENPKRYFNVSLISFGKK